jgi:uncharacterized protein (DUF433 family)
MVWMMQEVDKAGQQDGQSSTPPRQSDESYAANPLLLDEAPCQASNRGGIDCIRNAVLKELSNVLGLLRSISRTETKYPSPNLTSGDLLPGTDIPVLRVAALVKPIAQGRLDLSAAEMVFPALTRDQILAAFRYSRAYRVHGQEYPGNRLKARLDRFERLLMADRT